MHYTACIPSPPLLPPVSQQTSKQHFCTGIQLSSGGGLSPEDDPDTIHIFSVASGHMYERLQKIMILSVIRNTRYGHDH